MIAMAIGLTGVLILIIGLIVCICLKNRNHQKSISPLNVVSTHLWDKSLSQEWLTNFTVKTAPNVNYFNTTVVPSNNICVRHFVSGHAIGPDHNAANVSQLGVC